MMQAPCTVEIPRKYNDCYFYYYSTCTKGENCGFRHEPLALGCETMCPLWQQGKCVEKRCKLRHMELRKNRKQIPCYWENQPGGCRKKHCPFMHKNPDARTDGIAPSQAGAPMHVPVPMGPVAPGIPEQLPAELEMPAPNATPILWPPQRQVVLDSSILGVIPQGELLAGRPAPSPYTMPVDSLVVNFEEETKDGGRASPIDEMLLLEKIQAESAAYYSYSDLLVKKPSDKKILDALITKNIEFRRRSSLQSLDDIRTRESPGMLSIDRKRKLSTYESINSTTKVLKVVRSNSIVYKKLDENQQNVIISDCDNLTRRRTCSEQSDVIEIHEEDYRDYFRYRRIKRPSVTHSVDTPVRNVSISDASDDCKDSSDASKIDTSDSEAHADESKVSSDVASTTRTKSITEISDEGKHVACQPLSDLSKGADECKRASGTVDSINVADQLERSVESKVSSGLVHGEYDCEVVDDSKLVSDVVESVTVESSHVSETAKSDTDL